MYKAKILVGVTIVASLFAPVFSFAEVAGSAQTAAGVSATATGMNTQGTSMADLQAQLQMLLKQVAALQAQIKAAQTGVGYCHNFERNLRIGDKGDEIRSLQNVLQKEGFTIPQDEMNNGQYGENTAAAISGFQEKYRSDILTPNGLKYGTGFAGASTRARFNRIYGCGGGTVPPVSTVMIYGISPESGSVGAQVTIKGRGFTATDNTVNFGRGAITGLPATYAGTNCTNDACMNSTVTNPQSDIAIAAYSFITFTVPESLSPVCPPSVSSLPVPCPALAQMVTPGTYPVSVTNSNGTSNGVKFAVTGATDPARSITVLSPNGGETWTKGTTQTISWQDNAPVPMCPAGAACAPSAPKFYDIQLAPYYQPCTGNVCPMTMMYPYRSAYTIVNGVTGSSYSWSVGQVVSTATTPEGLTNNAAPEGSYTIQICQSGTAVCDSSDTYFRVVRGADTNLPPVISGVSGPATLRVGQQGTWTVKASDSANETLWYSVVWGDEANQYASGMSALSTAAAVRQTATFTHTYNTAGTYQPKFTVTNARGVSANTSLSVAVGSTAVAQPSVSSLTPSSGSIGASVYLNGAGFTPENNTVNFGYGVIPGLSAATWISDGMDGTTATGMTIIFAVPESLSPACAFTTPRCMMAAMLTAPGTYLVSVTNANGTSNSLQFTVTASTTATTGTNY
ncbi:MAG: IPT/TIG domain-containing protein [Candidatus Liptonbacteria bacterium]|nr:IPT/TIG domain-containing protein [Candidatus Liptonbacteria bacterium]